MSLFPQFPYSNLHELNLDWIIEQIRQIEGEGVVLSVNGMSGVVTLYTDKDVVFPDLNFNDNWQIFREIDNKIAGLKFTGEKFFYITKNEGDEEFTVQEVYTSGNQPPYPVRSVNGHTGNVVLAGDNIPYNIDGTYTIEDVIIPLEKSIGHVIRGNICSVGVSAGQYVYLILSSISGRSDGLYKAVNAKSAGTVWTSADLAPVAGGLGALMAQNDSDIATLNSKVTNLFEPITLANNTAYNLISGQSGRPIENTSQSAANFNFVMIEFEYAGRHEIVTVATRKQDGLRFHVMFGGDNEDDGVSRVFMVDFTFNGRYFDNVVIKVSNNSGAYSEYTGSGVYINFLWGIR